MVSSKLVVSAVTLITMIVLGGATEASAVGTKSFQPKALAAISTAHNWQPVELRIEAKPAVAPAEPAPAPVQEPQPAPVDPNGCEAQGMKYRADNNECIPNPAPAQSVTPAPETYSTGSGDCASEIAKYDWVQSVALAVAHAESGMATWQVNNTPATGDYSVGCFQVNIFGANARTRPSEAELMNAAVNVQWAYRIYVGNGHSFLGQWGVCNAKVSCY